MPPRDTLPLSEDFRAPRGIVDEGADELGPLPADEVAPLEATPPETEEPRDPDGEDVFAAAEGAAPRTDGLLVNLTGVRFRDEGVIQDYDAVEGNYQRGERVVVESERGQIVATVVAASRRALTSGPLRRILRRLTPDDERTLARLKVKEQEAARVCIERIRDRKLPMKLIDAEFPLLGNKIMFHFTSEERVDFRELVRDLSQRLHARIELRQVGARDEAKAIGGIGSCGCELCCSTYLCAFAPVSIRMAKDQGLVLNPSKVAGQCGRLKCCLVYEQDLYREMRRTMPKLGKRVRTPGGEGRVVELDVLRQRVRVALPDGPAQTFPASDVHLVNPPGASAAGAMPDEEAGSDGEPNETT